MKKNQNINNTGNNSISVQTNGNVDIDIVNRYDSPISPTLISKIIPKILNQLPDFEDSKDNLTSFEIVEKINYNDLKKYKEIIEFHSDYLGLVDHVLFEIDSEKPNSRRLFNKYIKSRYIHTKHNYLSKYSNESVREIEIIQEYSDSIIDAIKAELISSISPEMNFNKEEIEIGCELLVCQGFIDCNILEEPPK